MATCHTIQKLKDNQLYGESLEINMFQFTTWYFIIYIYLFFGDIFYIISLKFN